MIESLDQFLADSLDDYRLSRAERKTLAALLDEINPPADAADVRRRAIALARQVVANEANPAVAGVLDWLADVLNTLDARASEGGREHADIAEVHFSPGDECRDRIVSLLRQARRTVNICVFTITDDRLSDAILDAHRRGVGLRIITDDDKSGDLGSDIRRLEQAGIPVRVDHSEFHMHHKFAVFDGQVVLSGSYNWTRGAARDNEENVIVTNDPRLVGPFTRSFEHLWKRLG